MAWRLGIHLRRMRVRLALIILSLVCAGSALGGVISPSSAVAQVGTDVGVPVTYTGHTYAAAKPPTADKPQSKLWHLDGSWWALMVEEGRTRVTIHELMGDHTWRNTGTVVDVRADSTGDALWSARDNRLYVANRAPGSSLQVSALSYSSGSWHVVDGFPTTVASGGTSESATIDQDSLGRLWVTYTRGSRVWVAHSDAQQRSWTPGFTPAVPDTTIATDDLSALIAFGTSIGVLYSDQQSGGFHFAIHDDGAPDDVWRWEHIEDMPGMADDHINLKQLVGDPQGRIFAAIKTSAEEFGGGPTAPLVGVLTRTPGAGGSGSWHFAPAGTVADDHSRPLIMIDATNKELYFFATAPVSGGDIFYKKAPLSDIRFEPGRGTPFINAAPVVNNASGAKDPVTADTGMVLLAVAHGRKQYVHGEMRLAGGTVEDQSPTVMRRTPAPSAVDVAADANVTATFSEPVQGVETAFTLAGPDGTPVPASVVPGAGDTWVLDPSSALAPGTTYTARLVGGSNGIRDMAGNPLTPSPVSWSFTTAAEGKVGDGIAPVVVSSVPARGARSVGLAVTLRATFSEAVQGVTADTFELVNSATGAPVAATVRQGSSAKIWFLDPTASLAKDTWHTVTLTGGPSAIRDLSGTPLVTTSWEFLTGPAPRLSSRSPAPNATGVGLQASVIATFNEPVTNVTGATFVLTNPSGAQVEATVERDGTTNRWILDPTASLTAGTKYTVRLVGGTQGISDLAGNPMTTQQWSFTTTG